MQVLKVLALAIVLFLAPHIGDHDHNHILCKGFVPENDLWIPPSEVKALNDSIDENRFNEILDHVEQVYAPIVRSKGGRLVIRRLWNDGTVNAQAERQGSNYVVTMFGGLARHHTITPDAFYLVACHEVGHHIGGVPKYSDRGGTWASVEGQSDYFATLKCMRKVFAQDDNRPDGPVDPRAEEQCHESYSNTNDYNICLRIVMAGLSSANLFHALGGRGAGPSLGRRDNSEVRTTFESHPQPQCRLDTYLNGGICTADLDSDVSSRDPNAGVCARSRGEERGARPLCWYKPSGGGENPPPPVGDAAASPLLAGQTRLNSNNPNQVIPITWDVSNFPNAAGVYLEVSQPDGSFSNPNGTEPDPRALGGVTVRGNRGRYNLLPARQLPNWGSYQFRVFPLDRSGRQAVGKASNPSSLILQPNLTRRRRLAN